MTVVNDKRITKLGNFLRKSRIDEIPQIINILRGEMSFIGPRPEKPEYVEELANKFHFTKLDCLLNQVLVVGIRFPEFITPLR